MAKVIVGMSGGVDSAVAAYLLKKSGYEVIGLTVRTWKSDDGFSRCCEIDDARETARMLGIEYHVTNSTLYFDEYVIRPFIKSYLNGKTPNPCVDCNRYVKWARMLYYAELLRADFIATGHYAGVVRLRNGRFTLKKALYSEKDQTYMLYRLTQEQLSKTLMPLGGLSKDEVRGIAAGAGLPVAYKKDSQEICFVPKGCGYAGYIEQNAEFPLPGAGSFVDPVGNVLGKHRGFYHYTVGQRKGLGVALGYPVYVKEIDAENNRVVLGDESSIMKNEILCSDPEFMSIPTPKQGEKIRCTVKVRYRHVPQSAVVELMQSGLVRIVFDEPVKAAAPGQSAVFFDNFGQIIGGAVIEN